LKPKFYYKEERNTPSILFLIIVTLIFVGFIGGMSLSSQGEPISYFQDKLFENFNTVSEGATCAAFDFECHPDIIQNGYILGASGILMFFIGIGLHIGYAVPYLFFLNLPFTILYLLWFISQCYGIDIIGWVYKKFKEKDYVSLDLWELD